MYTVCILHPWWRSVCSVCSAGFWDIAERSGAPSHTLYSDTAYIHINILHDSIDEWGMWWKKEAVRVGEREREKRKWKAFDTTSASRAMYILIAPFSGSATCVPFTTHRFCVLVCFKFFHASSMSSVRGDVDEILAINQTTYYNPLNGHRFVLFGCFGDIYCILIDVFCFLMDGYILLLAF